VGPGLGANASLANNADLYVGGAPNGHYLNGRLTFMRIARGTLADSKTRSRNSMRGSSAGRSFTTLLAANVPTMAEQPAPLTAPCFRKSE